MSHFGPASFYRAILSVEKPQDVQSALEDEGQGPDVFKRFLEDAGVCDDQAVQDESGSPRDLMAAAASMDVHRAGRFLEVQQGLLPFSLPSRGDMLPPGCVVNCSPPLEPRLGPTQGVHQVPLGP